MIWLTKAVHGETPSGGYYLLQVVTEMWGKGKRDRGLHWPSASVGVARKGLKPLCAGIGYAKCFGEEGQCCQHMGGGKVVLRVSNQLETSWNWL